VTGDIQVMAQKGTQDIDDDDVDEDDVDEDVNDDVDEDVIVEELPPPLQVTEVQRLQDEGINLSQKEIFAMHLETASNGYDLWECIQMLPSCREKWGHAITMNNIIKTISRHSYFREQQHLLTAPELTKKGTAKTLILTYGGMNKEIQEHVKQLVFLMSPEQGSWVAVINILSTCDVAFSDEVLVNKKISVPSQRIACIAHMMKDPEVKAKP
jgi:hypothetical protein